MIEYRKATTNDINDLAKIRCIFLAEQHDNYPKAESEMLETANKAYFEANLADDSFIAWVAVAGDKIVGTSGLSFYHVPPNNSSPDGRVAYIMNMYTFPEYRKQGIAATLFNRIVEEAKIRGYKKIVLNATDMGKSLYEKYGFTHIKGDMEYLCK